MDKPVLVKKSRDSQKYHKNVNGLPPCRSSTGDPSDYKEVDRDQADVWNDPCQHKDCWGDPDYGKTRSSYPV